MIYLFKRAKIVVSADFVFPKRIENRRFHRRIIIIFVSFLKIFNVTVIFLDPRNTNLLILEPTSMSLRMNWITCCSMKDSILIMNTMSNYSLKEMLDLLDQDAVPFLCIVQSHRTIPHLEWPQYWGEDTITVFCQPYKQSQIEFLMTISEQIFKPPKNETAPCMHHNKCHQYQNIDFRLWVCNH